LIKLLPAKQVNIDNNFSISWREATSILGFNGALMIMMQFERLIVPKVLAIEVLATLAVLMTVAGSPFRMLQLGTRFTMLPLFRSADSAKERRRILLIEGIVIFSVAIAASIAVWLIAPILFSWFLSGKYIISKALIMAVITVGFAKILDAVASTAITALGSTKELSILTSLSWVALGISGLGAAIGANWGLVGVIYGVGFGWFFRTMIASALALRYF